MFEQFLVNLHIGDYHDEVLCDVLPMDACHILLSRSWLFDRNAAHDGRQNTYQIEKGGRKS